MHCCKIAKSFNGSISHFLSNCCEEDLVRNDMVMNDRLVCADDVPILIEYVLQWGFSLERVIFRKPNAS